ncbi:MAG: mechanosensitive ion channel family protein [Nitrososphaerales archaeon]|jgi:small-conductance mechanosensitive channel
MINMPGDAGTPPQRKRTLELALLAAGSIAIVALATSLIYARMVPEVFVAPLYAAVIVVDGYLIIRFVDVFIERSLEPAFGPTRTHGVKNLFQIVAAVVVVSGIFTVFGVNLTALLVGAGFLGIVLGLAAQQVLGNIFAGISIFLFRPFEIGDRVTIVNSSYGLLAGTYSHENAVNGYTGTIRDVGIFFTRVQLDEGTPSVFPNSVMTQSLVISYTKAATRRTRVRVDVDRKIDFGEFKSRMLQALKAHEWLDAGRSELEIVDVGPTTYQVVIAVWTQSLHEEPVRTLVIGEALRVLGSFVQKAPGDQPAPAGRTAGLGPAAPDGGARPTAPS